MMAERGLSLTYETIRYWCLKFGHLYAKQMRKRKVWGDTWGIVKLTWFQGEGAVK